MRDPQRGYPPPAALWGSEDLGLATKAVAAYLWSYAGSAEGGFVFPLPETLRRDLGGLSGRQLRRHLVALVGAGWLRDAAQEGRQGWVLLRPDLDTSVPAADTSVPAADTSVPVADESVTDTSVPTSDGNVPTSDTSVQPDGQKCPPERTHPSDPADIYVRPSKVESANLSGSECNARAPASPVVLVGGGRDPRVDLEATKFREWLTWHAPQPNGWPRLTGPTLVEERLEGGWTRERLEALVVGAAELAEAGKLPRAEWRATYVFGQWTAETLEERVEDHRAPPVTTDDGTPLGDRYTPPDPEPADVHELDDLVANAGDLEVQTPFLRELLGGGGDRG